MQTYGYGQERTYRPFRPIVTWALLAANILFYLYLEWDGSTSNSLYMVSKGTLVVSLVVEQHQYYRLVTAFFMHFGFAHLFNNMLLLWYLGMRVEEYLGHLKFVVSYMICGIGANVVSLFYYMKTNPYVSTAGASGAVFGIVGAMLWIVIRNRGRLAGVTSRQLLLMIIFTLYSGFSESGINNAAHISGLIIGFILGVIFYRGGSFPGRKQYSSPYDGTYAG